MQQRADDPQITGSTPYTKRLYVHRFRIDSLDQFGEQFAGRLREAYLVGAGAHLANPSNL